MKPLRWLLQLLLALAFSLTGCLALASLPTPGLPIAADPPGEDGLSAPAGLDMLSGDQPGLGGALTLAGMLQPAEVRERVPAVQDLLGLSALKAGSIIAWRDGTPPRSSLRYELADAPDSLLGSLALTPQPARLPVWLQQPAVRGYVYVNDLLGTIDGLDRFLTSDGLTSQLRLSGALGGGAGVSSLMRDLYEIGFEEDFANWWTGEFLLCWVDDGIALRPVWIFRVHDARIANDKARQMLAMYYFYLYTDRGVFTTEPLAGGGLLHRLAEYGGSAARMDLAYALDQQILVLGGADAVQRLLQQPAPPATSDPQQHFQWDASVLLSTPKSIAMGFDGSDEAASIMSQLFERGVGLMPGGGREAAGRMGAYFGQPGIQRLWVDIVPGRLQWWVMGAAGSNPEQLSTLWNTGQVGLILAVASMKGWGQSNDVMAGSQGITPMGGPAPNQQGTRRARRPFWRKRR